jgi:hypothetical protein
MNQEGSSSSKHVPTEDSSLLANPKYPTQEYGTVEPEQYQRSRAGFCKYIIIFLCLITSILLLFIVYWVPGMAEQSVDKGVRFQFQKAAMLDMDDNHITMHVSGQIALDSKLTDWTHTFYALFGTIETRQTKLDVYMNETSKIGTINLPSMVLANANVTEFDFINALDIQDKQALMDFCQSAVAENVVYWNIKGPLAVSFGWWGAETNIDKSVELQGLL